MRRSRRHLLMSAFKLADVCLFITSFGLSTLFVSQESGTVSLAEFLSMRISIRNIVGFVGMLGLWHLILGLTGLYHSKRLSTLSTEIADLLRATLVGTVCLAILRLCFNFRMLDVRFLVSFWIISSAFVIGSRVLLRTALHSARRRDRNLRNMLAVGTNPRVREFLDKIRSHPELGYSVIGFADDPWPGTPDFVKGGDQLLCSLEELPSFLRQSVVDEVVMGLPLKSCYQQASRVAAICEEQGVILRFPSTIFNLKIGHAEAEDFEGGPLITVFTGVPESSSTIIKRLVDIVVSAALIVVSTPLLLITAVLIKMTSPGPVLFVQKRLGLNKRLFSMYKFRTMVLGAEEHQQRLEAFNEAAGPVFKIKNDPRITALGHLLRKTSIDELPQLFNVLKGDMSLVGPRPLPLRDYKGFNEDWQRRRFSVRPGITCLWQVKGRCSISFEKWMQLDMEYIDCWSLWLDFKILFMTIPAVFRGVGAV